MHKVRSQGDDDHSCRRPEPIRSLAFRGAAGPFQALPKPLGRVFGHERLGGQPPDYVLSRPWRPN